MLASDEDILKLKRGGHDPNKVHAAFKAAVEHKGNPTVVLAKTIKGYGLGAAGEGMMAAHNTKKMAEDIRLQFRQRFNLPLTDQQIHVLEFFKPGDDSPEIKYLKERRQALGGPIPTRSTACPSSSPSRTLTVPSKVNFSALLSRLKTTFSHISRSM